VQLRTREHRKQRRERAERQDVSAGPDEDNPERGRISDVAQAGADRARDMFGGQGWRHPWPPPGSDHSYDGEERYRV